MNTNQITESRVDQLVTWYGDGANGGSPTRSQWQHIVSRPADSPVTLLNFFKLHSLAHYPDRKEPQGTGESAFENYATVSMPTLEKVGGKFLLVAPYEDMFIGENEDWDLIAIGSYPNSAALLALFEDAGYRAAYPHRTAACARQKVAVCSG